MMGVYRITNRITGDFYIGSSVDIRHRMGQHFSKYKVRLHTERFDQDLQRYGKDGFDVEVIEECEFDELREREEFYLCKYHPPYNLRWKGYKRSEETRRKLSEKLIGRTVPRGVVEKARLAILKRHETIPQTNAGHKKRVSVDGAEFESVKACAEYFGVNPSTATQALKKGHKLLGHEVRYVV